MLTRRHLLLAALGTAAANAAGANPVVGCQTNAWKINPPDFEELLGKAAALKALGFASFECNVRFVESQFGKPREARERIAETGLVFYGPHTDLHWPLDQLLKYADGGASIGAKHMALSAGPGGNVKLDAEALGRKLDTINRLGAHCRGLGVRLVSHNYPVDYTDSQAGIEEMLRQTDPEAVSLQMDIGNAFGVRTDVTAFFERHHRRIDSFHLRDLRSGKQVPLGQGEVDFQALGAAIRRIGWSGCLTLEEETLHSTDNAYIRSVLASSREVIRKCFAV